MGAEDAKEDSLVDSAIYDPTASIYRKVDTGHRYETLHGTMKSALAERAVRN
jgi:hypothetical protein